MDHYRSSSSKSVSQLFSSDQITQNYAQFRPVYGPETYEKIYDFCRETSASSDLAIDVGCGSGQSSVPLTKYYTKVIGVDVSESQLAQAPSNIPDLSFRCSPAEDLCFVEDETADLITVAQAFHWFDREKFFKEMDRVLKPGGSLVLYGYGNFDLDNKEATSYKQKVYSEVLSQYWDKGRQHIDSKYASITLPYEGWRRDDSLLMEKEWTVQELVGYFSSWSAVNTLLSENPKSTFLADICSEFLKLYGCPDQPADSVKVRITWPIFILMGHKPL